MMKRCPPFTILLATLVIVSPRATHADELKLKDGTKIVGTIVGFEENSFKVKTNYGFAVVQKDQVLSISITDSAKKPDAEKKSEPSSEKPAPACGGRKFVQEKQYNSIDATQSCAAPRQIQLRRIQKLRSANAPATAKSVTPAATSAAAPAPPPRASQTCPARINARASNRQPLRQRNLWLSNV